MLWTNGNHCWLRTAGFSLCVLILSMFCILCRISSEGDERDTTTAHHLLFSLFPSICVKFLPLTTHLPPYILATSRPFRSQQISHATCSPPATTNIIVSCLHPEKSANLLLCSLLLFGGCMDVVMAIRAPVSSKTTSKWQAMRQSSCSYRSGKFGTQSGCCALRPPRLVCYWPWHRRQTWSDISSSPISPTASPNKDMKDTHGGWTSRRAIQAYEINTHSCRYRQLQTHIR